MTAKAKGQDGPGCVEAPPGGPSGVKQELPARPASVPIGAPYPWRQILLITVVSVALFVLVRRLPTGTNLSHLDFRVQGGNVIQFCDPTNPQFIPVVAVRSPVVMTLHPFGIATPGSELRVAFTLHTSTGRPISPEDLLVVHTKRLHLLIVDPMLEDYQHVHPDPGPAPGEWGFAFTPVRAGAYRVFADFTPVATNRGLYAYADLLAAGGPAEPRGPPPARTEEFSEFEKGDLRIGLTPAEPLRAGRPADLKLTLRRTGGGAVRLEPVMDAYAHLVAFDRERSGFAHLHPVQTDLAEQPDLVRPTMNFKITIPTSGSYIIWAQTNVGGREVFAPFWFTVAP